MLQPFFTPRTLQIYLRQTILCSPKLKMKLKGLHFPDVAEIQEAVTDELKKAQKKRNFRQLFRNCTTAQKPVCMYVCVCVCVYVCIYIYTHTHTNGAYFDLIVAPCVCVCVCVYIYIYIYIYTHTHTNGAYFELKKSMCLPHVSSIFKKISPKIFGPHCVYQYAHHKQLKLLRLPVPWTVISNIIYIKAT